ncbi:MAG: mercury methylation ferredoxin HgcB [Desulfonatronovibrionaceae bacterium]
MRGFKYLSDVSTLRLDKEKCVGCGQCVAVCPHAVFKVTNARAEIVDKDGCMECGACALNCPGKALDLDPGVGCAALIISRWLKKAGLSRGTSPSCC